MSENITIREEGRIVYLTISRVEKKNSITQDMYAVMADTIVAYGENDQQRALVITGEGDMFTAGNDLKDFSTGDLNGEDMPPVGRFLQAIKDCPKPMIAAVNGPAIGVGLTMLLHCDLVYAGEAATFTAPFVSLGVVPEAASSLLLPQYVGMAVANDILLGGRKLNAAEALDFGLVARVFPDDELMAEVEKIAQNVAGSAPNAMRRSKALIRNQQEKVSEQMKEESIIFTEQLKSPEFMECVAAFMQKRVPLFD